MKYSNRFAIALLIASAPVWATATGPVVPLDFEQFDYSEDAYLGQQFGFANYIEYSTINLSDPSNEFDLFTELSGHIAPADQVGDLSAFLSGTAPRFVEKGLGDLFGDSTPPSNLHDINVGFSATGTGDTLGFTSVTLNHHGFASLEDGPANADSAFAEFYSQLVFEAQGSFVGPGNPVAVELLFFLDALAGLFDDGGDISQGFEVQVLDVTDPSNPVLMNEIGGFYLIDDEESFGDASIDDTDVSDQFSFLSSPGVTGAQEVGLALLLEMELQQGNVYAVSVFSDLGISALGPGADGGSVYLDSSNTLGVTLSVADPANARLVLPGAIPEPGTLAMVAAAGVLPLFGRNAGSRRA